MLRYGARPDEDLERAQGTAAAGANTDPWDGSALHYAAAALGGRCGRGVASVEVGSRAAENQAAIMATLLEAGADPCRENSSGLTALDLLFGLVPYETGSGSVVEGQSGKAVIGRVSCLSGLRSLVRREQRGSSARTTCPHRAAALRNMLAASTAAVTASSGGCTMASIQV